MLNALKTVDGMSLTEVTTQCRIGQFRGLNVEQNDAAVRNNIQMRSRFLHALIDNLRSRFPPEELLEAGGALNPVSWPVEEDQKAVFGDQHVLRLPKICHVNGHEAVDDFRQYKNNTKCIGQGLQVLLTRVKLLPVSSAECERGISCMNIMDTDVRNRLSIKSLSSLIIIKVNGPQPSRFNPTLYVRKWLEDGHHGSQDNLSRANISDKPDPAIASLF
jgi:hypothetical protein